MRGSITTRALRVVPDLCVMRPWIRRVESQLAQTFAAPSQVHGSIFPDFSDCRCGVHFQLCCKERAACMKMLSLNIECCDDIECCDNIFQWRWNCGNFNGPTKSNKILCNFGNEIAKINNLYTPSSWRRVISDAELFENRVRLQFKIRRKGKAAETLPQPFDVNEFVCMNFPAINHCSCFQ